MTINDTNPRPWRDRITVDDDGRYCLVDGGEFHRIPNATLRSLLGEAKDLAAEVKRLRTLLATAIAVGSDAIEAQLAARPAAHDLPDGVQPWTGDPIEIDGVPVVGVAMGDVVKGLSDDEWLRAQCDEGWCQGANANAGSGYPYLLGRKPQPTPPATITVELPQDVAERLASDANVRHRWTDVEATIAACRKALGR